MEKNKEFLHKISKNLILYPIVLIITIITIHFYLKVCNLRLRGWVYLTVTIISIITVLTKLIIMFIKQSTQIKRIIGFICGILITFGIIFWQIPIMLFFILSFMIPSTEHVVEKDGKKYVACVDARFLDTTVTYYDYINFFIMGDEVRECENYNGSYDPIERQEKNNIQQENKNEIIKEEIENKEKGEDEEVLEESTIIYEQEINSSTFMRVLDRGNILGQKKIIQIQKSTNNKRNWRNQIKSEDGSMTVNQGAKFIFINERVGFINNLSLIILGEENDSLLVTVNGGESFKCANFVFPLDIEDTAFYVCDLPYMEEEKLKIKLFAPTTIGHSDGNYYEFSSIDNGLNWMHN